jgi:hypothetical protein
MAWTHADRDSSVEEVPFAGMKSGLWIDTIEFISFNRDCPNDFRQGRDRGLPPRENSCLEKFSMLRG